METKLRSRHRCFEGQVEYHEHASVATGTPMRFSIFLPPQAAKGPVPVVYWLSGLTCTEDNFTVKSGVQRAAARLGLAVVAPDTSPRGANIPGEDASDDVGTGAGFYVNATQEPWAKHYRMYDYVVAELPVLIEKKFPVQPGVKSICGHSMGGHGALIVALKNPGQYRSVSAFAPICAPSQREWGTNAFALYLGSDKSKWAEWDANELVKKGGSRQPLFIDQGAADPHLEKRLLLSTFIETCKKHDHPLEVKLREGYDHGYFYVSTFIAEHVEYHAKFLRF